MFPHPDLSAFPPVPEVAAEWAPVYLEPIAGAGERIAVGIAARAASGPAHYVLPVLRDRVARCMYGDHADHVTGITALVLESLESHLEAGGQLAEWAPPLYGSTELGRISTGYGHTVEDVARTGAQLAASLIWATPMANETVQTDPLIPDPDTDEWVRQIRDATLAMRENFGPRFLTTVKISSKAPPTRIGYLGDRLAAQFGRLIPGRGLANSRNRAKAYLAELQMIRDNEPKGTMFPRRQHELILWTPPSGSPQFTPAQHEEAIGALEEMESFGDKHELRVAALHTAEAARARILRAEEPSL